MYLISTSNFTLFVGGSAKIFLSPSAGYTSYATGKRT